jgi:parvulin-like peptidyl-prolyl isomerase
MKFRTISLSRCLVLVLFLAGLMVSGPVQAARKPSGPDKVTVQHILIGFKRSVRNKKIARTKKEAKVLAEDLLRRIQEGEDFDALVREFTDDSYPGFLSMTNRGIDARGRLSRDDMVPGFGDAAFRLEVGETALVPYSARLSPFGWHLVQRVE